MQEIKYDQVKPVITYLISHHSRFQANKQVISVVSTEPHMPAVHDKQIKKKLSVNGKRKTSPLTIIHEEKFSYVTWHLIHSKVTI